MFTVTEAEAAEIRTAFRQGDEFSAALPQQEQHSGLIAIEG